MPSAASRALTIDPAILQRLTGIELRSRFLVRGLFSSRHRTSDFGSSMEFIEHREYRWGDELRTIDWRVFGRSDRFYVKVHEMEADMRVQLVVDTSESMRVRPAPGLPGKLDLACVIAGAVATMAVEQQDSVGLFMIGDRIDTHLPARQGEMHLSQIFGRLSAPRGRGGGAFGRSLLEAGARAGTRGMMFVMTDALDDAGELSAALRILRQRTQDVTLIRIFDRRELDFPFDRMTEFRDPENDRRVYADPQGVRQNYLLALRAHRDRVADICRRAEADLLELDNTSDLARLLSSHMIRRLTMRGMGRC